MPVQCVTCAREFKDLHALKSHQPKCHGRPNAHARGFQKPKREPLAKSKLPQHHGMNVTNEEVVVGMQELGEGDGSEPVGGPAGRDEVCVA